MNNIKCNQSRQTLSRSVPVLNVCTTDEFNDGCLSNTKNIPLAVMPLLAQQYFKRNKPVLIFSHSGSRVIIAEKILASLGFTDVTNMDSISIRV